MRLQKLICERGLASRRRAEEWIAGGLVTVDGQVAVLGDKVDPERQTVLVNGAPLPPRPTLCYIALYKPRGVVTTMKDEQGRRAVPDCLPPHLPKLLPVGRLDRDSEGLLLLTNDGDAAARLMHPSHQVEKEYHVTLRGDIVSALPILRSPMTLDGVTVGPADVTVLNDQKISMVIREGRNRQVRRMCVAAGLDVRRLTRVRVGCITLGNLKPGMLRELTEEEIRWIGHV